MTCSPIPAAYKLVALVARSEWFVRNPKIPADLHIELAKHGAQGAHEKIKLCRLVFQTLQVE
jgi:hypothetical protein